MKHLSSLVFLLVLGTATTRTLQADPIVLTPVIINISLTEDDLENLLTANVTLQFVGSPAVGGVAPVNADKIHFTFPFAITLDPRFPGAGMGIPVTLQDFLDRALATTLGSVHQNGLDGGDPISYAANGGTPIGAFMSRPGDDSPAETGTATEKDTWVYSLQRQIGQNTILSQDYQINYSVVSPAEGKAVPEAPEPASWALAAAGWFTLCATKFGQKVK